MTGITILSLPAGVIIASLASAVGIGGGILWMPFFIIFLKLEPETAVVTSLLVQTAGMGSGSAAFIRKKKADLSLAGFFLLLTLPRTCARRAPDTVAVVGQPGTGAGDFDSDYCFSFCVGKPEIHRYGSGPGTGESCPSIRMAGVAHGNGQWYAQREHRRMAGASHPQPVEPAHASCRCHQHRYHFWHLRRRLRVASDIGRGGGSDGIALGGSRRHYRWSDWTMVHRKINERILKEVFIFLLTLIGIHLIYNSY